ILKWRGAGAVLMFQILFTLALVLAGILLGIGFIIWEKNDRMVSVPLEFLVLFGLAALGLGWLAWRWQQAQAEKPRPTPCPSPARLKDYLEGRVPDHEQPELARHLEVCARCQHRMEGLVAGKESWSGMARQLAQQAPMHDAALKHIIDK